MRLRASPRIIATLAGSVIALTAADRVSAATLVLGSDLAATATRAFANPYDIAFWSPQLPNGSSTQAPAAGQILEVRIKGCAERSRTNPPGSPNYMEPLTQTHFQALKPEANGTLTLNATTNPFYTPICGDPGIDQNYISTFKPINLCVNAGDYVDWTDAGGFDGVPSNYPQGVYYDFFAPSPSARTMFFRTPNALDVRPFGPTPATEDPLAALAAAPLYPYTVNYAGTGSQNLELLMSLTLGTGPDATPLCPGGTRGVSQRRPGKPAPSPSHRRPRPRVVLHAQADRVNHRRLTRVHLFCSGAAAHCAGTVSLTVTGAPVLASARFDTVGGKTAKLVLRITPTGLRLLRAHNRRLGVTMTVVLDPGGPTNTFMRGITLEF